MSMTRIPSEYLKEEYIYPPQGGLSTCPGCVLPAYLRLFLKIVGDKVIFVGVPGCAAILMLYPRYAIRPQGKSIPLLSSPLGSAASFASGLKSALTAKGDTQTNVVAWTGDGAAFDIGFGALSSAAERNEDIIYVCNDNEAYQNTGDQRSSATPWGATTTTNPPPNPKAETKKDIMSLMAGHGIPYAATASIGYLDDFIRKVQKAKDIKGFRFLHLLVPCVTGWRFPEELAVKLSRLAVETKIFPLFEIQDGITYTINKEPEGIAVEEYIKIQGRYRYLTLEQIADIQKKVDQRWHRLQWLASYNQDARKEQGNTQ